MVAATPSPAGAVMSRCRSEIRSAKCRWNGEIGPALHIGAHCGIAGVISKNPTLAQQLLAIMDDLDRGPQLVGINPDDDLPDDAAPAYPVTQLVKGGYCVGISSTSSASRSLTPNMPRQVWCARRSSAGIPGAPVRMGDDRKPLTRR